MLQFKIAKQKTMPEPSQQNLNPVNGEYGETMPPNKALQLHGEVRDAIASELGIDPRAAEQETGQYFVDKVEDDIQDGAPHAEVMTDADAALISGGTQLVESSSSQKPGLGSDYFLTKHGLLLNPIVKLEQTHPDLVTSAVAELADDKRTSKFAQIAATVIDKMKSLASRVTPVVAPTGTVMSLHTANKYMQFAEEVSKARAELVGNPYENFFHKQPPLEEFKKWKKTGVVELGITSPVTPPP